MTIIKSRYFNSLGGLVRTNDTRRPILDLATFLSVFTQEEPGIWIRDIEIDGEYGTLEVMTRGTPYDTDNSK